jgi:hypothetical protein
MAASGARRAGGVCEYRPAAERAHLAEHIERRHFRSAAQAAKAAAEAPGAAGAGHG